MDKRKVLAVAIAALGFGWGVGRITAPRPELDEVLQRLDAEQARLATLDWRTKAIDTALQTRSSVNQACPTARAPTSNDRIENANPAPAPVAPEETPQNLAARAEGERLLSSAISAGVWTRNDELKLRQALVRMSPVARHEILRRQTIAMNNQQLSGAGEIHGPR